MNLEPIKLPQNWYSMKINKECNLYLNIKEKVATLAPVFELRQCRMVLKDVLGFSVDFALLDKSILKLRSSINM